METLRMPVILVLVATIFSSMLLSNPFSLAQITTYVPPATPTSLNSSVIQGPPPAPPNETAQPLPPVPSGNESIGSTTLDTSQPSIFFSIPVPSTFLGVSIELSVADEIIGRELDNVNVAFLNYMAAVAMRAGAGPVIRIGGNTQDTAVYNNTPVGSVLRKTTPHGYDPVTGAPYTPRIEFNELLFDIVADAADMLGSEIIFGVNMVDLDADFSPRMVSDLADALGDRLLMLLVGNEPDRYSKTGVRSANFSIPDYIDEWGQLTSRISSKNEKIFVAPSVCCAWTTNQVMTENGMQERYAERIKAISAIKYPQSLCSVKPTYGHAGYLNQSAIVEFASYDQDAVAAAVAAQVPYYLVETNSASCIGVAGVADSFTSTIWGVNAALQLAFRNHTGVLFHTSGQSTLYNLFTPPAHDSKTRAWITGPIMYSLLVVAEALASTDGENARVKDLGVNSTTAAAYAVYDTKGEAVKMVLINMANDPSGNNDWEATVPIGQGRTSLRYKSLSAPSVQEKEKISWAGQSFGYYSDGILQGEESIEESNDCQRGSCRVRIKAPGVVLAFLSELADSKASVGGAPKFESNGTSDASVVLSSNGSRGNKGGATSKGSINSATSNGGGDVSL
ncbi:hypothetical protein IE53DRAFT_371609 [Violaceomyces palustris]|uniref:Uncharacterized protein n=1 Tax=Violaceomyces palustris TaxID=1673888 RepID=A0ACD0NN56_9BASI|nr:hypothetical protein IE53DRAFT_371609 [Violaceomyces palustris]